MLFVLRFEQSSEDGEAGDALSRQIRVVRGRGTPFNLSQPPGPFPFTACNHIISAVLMSPGGLNTEGEHHGKEHSTTNDDVYRRRRRRSRTCLGFATLVSLVIGCATPMASAFMSSQARVARLSALGKYPNGSPLALGAAAAGGGRVTSRGRFSSTTTENCSTAVAHARRCVHAQ